MVIHRPPRPPRQPDEPRQVLPFSRGKEVVTRTAGVEHDGQGSDGVQVGSGEGGGGGCQDLVVLVYGVSGVGSEPGVDGRGADGFDMIRAAPPRISVMEE